MQPILADEVQTFKALITVHKVLQEGHPVVCPLSHESFTTFMTCNRLSRKRTVRQDGLKLVLVPLDTTVLEVCYRLRNSGYRLK